MRRIKADGSAARIAIASLAGISLIAQIRVPERTVTGTVISSERDPKIRIELPATAHYIGADRWPLYDIADCELHAFVETGTNKIVRRLYWIQFEQYLPTRPDLHHTYDSLRTATLGGMSFYVDTWARPANAPTRPGSDVEHMRGLVRAKGYSLPGSMMSVRLVHLLDDAKRKELMIIYSEDLSPTGFTADDLSPSGRARNHWPEIDKALLYRALAQVKIVQPG
ncbi:MAG: hypothetical protein JO108_26160 [Acidobacteriaceae bacterium]|nr:hypothetical protein [Acidobacteriaceae bacterium]